LIPAPLNVVRATAFTDWTPLKVHQKHNKILRTESLNGSPLSARKTNATRQDATRDARCYRATEKQNDAYEAQHNCTASHLVNLPDEIEHA